MDLYGIQVKRQKNIDHFSRGRNFLVGKPDLVKVMSPSYPGHIVLVRKYMIFHPGKDLCKSPSYSLQPLSSLSSYSKCIVQKLYPLFFLIPHYLRFSGLFNACSIYQNLILWVSFCGLIVWIYWIVWIYCIDVYEYRALVIKYVMS